MEEKLNQILANQVVIFKMLRDIELKNKGIQRSAPLSSYMDELLKQAKPIIDNFKI